MTFSTPEQERLSIVIPFFNEEDNVDSVLHEVLGCQPTAEIIAVDDGSDDSTWALIEAIPGVTGIRFSENRGQSAAMLAGLNKATSDICVTMDGDGQNDPADIAALVARLTDVDAVFGYRKFRKDTRSRRAASMIANFIRRKFTDDGIKDTGCSLKAFRRELVQYLPPVNCAHRFMGSFFTVSGHKIREIPVNHRPRLKGESKYTNLGRALRGVYDLIGVNWYLKRNVDYKVTGHE